MAQRKDLKKIVILGSGPIVIGQACEFDYSGTQACKALKEKNYEVILINSNPATIMTDPDIADRVYVEPLTVNFVEKILEKEKPCALISTLGGQTALNLSLDLHKKGVLDRLNIELLGAKPDVIESAEDRQKFNKILDQIGACYPQSHLVCNFKEGLEKVEAFKFPIILRPNYTLGGGGGGACFSLEEYKNQLALALEESPTSEVLIEQSILGWNEFELEVVRDQKGTFVVVCSIENIDPCGVHTGDSITVAPQQTLSDYEYQQMRTEACAIIQAVGVETGGANIQFAVDPKTRKRVVIEMNPRVSRSSALASKATGFPIAKLAALLCVGFELEELKNDITQTTPACYEPALDYVVTKVPLFNFNKFFQTKDVLTTQMRSVGEVMGIGRTFQESLQKALLSLEQDHAFEEVIFEDEKLTYPNSKRMNYIYEGFKKSLSVSQMEEKTLINPWFLEQIKELVDFEKEFKTLNETQLLRAKRYGFSDSHIAKMLNKKPQEILEFREKNKISPCYFQVDTCAGEFQSETPYYYSSYWSEAKPPLNIKKAITIIGSGPNRIGQGVEFDYSCVRGVKQLQKENVPVVMVNSNPETVSTDYDTADFLFFEPLIKEHVLEVLKFVNGFGFIAQLGGQTPLNIAEYLEEKGHKLLGSSLNCINKTEDREQFITICKKIGLNIPKSKMVHSLKQALSFVDHIGFPVICRPSYVLGGRRMEILETTAELESYFLKYKDVINENNLCLIDQFLERALETDVDLVRGKNWSVIGGVIEHIETAGIHSGDSMGVLPPQKLKKQTCEKIEKLSLKLADQLEVIGLLNIQFAVKNDEVYILEANPRGSRSVPFVCKSTQVPLVSLAIQAILGLDKKQINPSQFDWKKMKRICVKGVVFPFKKFPKVDMILGPEMKSTGESMGQGEDYAEALIKAFLSTHHFLPKPGEVFISLRDKDKVEFLEIIPVLEKLGYYFTATSGTYNFLKTHGVQCQKVNKVHEGRPHCVDRIRSKKVQFVINTTSGTKSIDASFSIRRSCIDYLVPCLTDIDTAKAFCYALKNREKVNVYFLDKSKDF